jgi:epoxide hydrolase 4
MMAPSTPAQQWQHQSMLSNGIRLHYVSQGEGPLMLMLHGFPDFWYSWRHQIPEFARDYRVVALDLRGYNDSEKPAGLDAYRMEELVEDVRGVIQGLGHNTCILVGHDWGGAIAWTFANTYPHLLNRLIAVNFPHPARFAEGLTTLPQLLRSWYAFFFQVPVLPEALLQAFDFRLLTTTLQQMAVNPDTFTEVDLQNYREAMAKPGALTTMINYYRANLLQASFLKQDWQPLKVPTLLIWGEQDVALGRELTEGTEVYVPDLTIRYIPDAGHWVHQEQPILTNQLIREFLR